MNIHKYLLLKFPRNSSRKIKCAIATIVLGLCISPMASAAFKTLDDVVNSIDNFHTDLVGQVVRPFINFYKELIQAIDTKWSVEASLANTSEKTSTVEDFLRDQIDQKSLQKLAQTLTQKESSQQIQGLAVLPASDTKASAPAPQSGASSLSGIFGKPSETAAPKNWNEDDRRLYADSLMGKLAYTTDTDKNNAEQALSFLSDYASPLGSIDPSTLNKEQVEKMNSSPEGQRYRVHIRTLAAVRSLALSNFYHMLMERMPVKNLGKNAGLPGHDTAGNGDASPLEVESYIATRRVNSADWYTYMNKAPEVIVARETLFVLAEMEKQLFEIKQQNERILATLTVMAVQSLNATKILPDKSEADLRQALGLEPAGPAAEISKQVNEEKEKRDEGKGPDANAYLEEAGAGPAPGSEEDEDGGSSKKAKKKK